MDKLHYLEKLNNIGIRHPKLLGIYIDTSSDIEDTECVYRDGDEHVYKEVTVDDSITLRGSENEVFSILWDNTEYKLEKILGNDFLTRDILLMEKGETVSLLKERGYVSYGMDYGEVWDVLCDHDIRLLAELKYLSVNGELPPMIHSVAGTSGKILYETTNLSPIGALLTMNSIMNRWDFKLGE